MSNSTVPNDDDQAPTERVGSTDRAMTLIHEFVTMVETDQGLDLSAERGMWQEFGAVCEVAEPFDGLDDHDLRHTVAAMYMDLSEGRARIESRRQAVLAGQSDSILHDPVAVAGALAKVRDLAYT